MKKFLLFTFICASIIILEACNEKVTDVISDNQAPHTYLSLFPENEISLQQSKLKVHWWGDDPDGLVVGYFFTWDNVNWAFTTKNDSTFALRIGVSDTSYVFRVAAADNSGNGEYDQEVIRNGINFGPEPFIDANKNGAYDQGEKYFDIGLVDPKPANLKFPIKNSAPVISWNSLTVVPDTSYPVMTFGWEANDIDGNETIQKINIALNDTTKFITLPGSARLVMLRMRDFNQPGANQMEVLVNALESNIFPTKLPGLKLNDNNKIYIQAEDISGAKSKFIPLPSDTKKWYVKKPAGKLLVIDDNKTADGAGGFYKSKFDALANGTLANHYETWDLARNKVPYENVTFLETLKLFKYIFWYTDNDPSLSLAGSSARKYLDYGGKIAFSMIFPQSVDQQPLQAFLPIDSTGTTNNKSFTNSLIGGTVVNGTDNSYPSLKTTGTVFRVRTFYPTSGGAVPVYNLVTTQLTTNKIIGFADLSKKLFFFGLPLSKSDGENGNVKALLEKVFIQDFGLTL